MEHDQVFLVNKNSNPPKWLLSKESEFTIGRHISNSVIITNSFISRFQCVIRYEEPFWVIYDKSSTKSTRVNGKQIEKCNLEHDDIITFSVPVERSIEDYQFTFQRSLNRDEPPRKRSRLDESPADRIELDSVSDFDNQCQLHTLEAELSAANKKNDENSNIIDNLRAEVEELKEENLRLESSRKALQLQCLEGHDKNYKLSEQLNDLREEMILVKQEILLERTEHAGFEDKMKEMQDQLADAEAEIECLVESLKVKKQDEDEKGSLSPLSNVEVTSLRSDLALMTDKFRETSKKLVDSLDEKDNIINAVKVVVDTELICSVCQDILYKATTLNCKHTFCDYCIHQWTKHKHDCPVCRAAITSKCETLLIDTVIDSLIELLDEEMKEKRRTGKMERDVPRVRPPNNGRGQRGGRRRGGRSGGRSGRGGGRRRTMTDTISDMVDVLRDRFLIYRGGSHRSRHYNADIEPIDLTSADDSDETSPYQELHVLNSSSESDSDVLSISSFDFASVSATSSP